MRYFKLLSCGLLFISSQTFGQYWNTSLNTSTTTARIGLTSNQSLGFYTNNVQRLILTNAGRFGIGTSEPTAELHVTGRGYFSSNLESSGSLILSSNFHLDHIPATLTTPNIVSYRTGGGSNPAYSGYTSPLLFHSVCDVVMIPPNTEPNGNTSRIAFGPQTAHLFSDLIQIEDPAQYSTLNLGILNGNGIIGLEPIPGVTFQGTRALKLNPGCPVDVHICEGGGRTRIFYGADIRLGLNVFDRGIKNTVPLNGDQAFTIISRDNNVNGTETFKVFGDGSVDIRNQGGQPSATSVLNVYESTGGTTLKLLNLGSAAESTIFEVKGNGATNLRAAVNSGYVMRVKNNGNDVFAVNTAGVAYAREVIVTLNNFPDYVFDPHYSLMPIGELGRFVNEQRHLPGMPQAAEVEACGASIGEVQKATVEKLEEAYLYILQLEERLQSLSRKVELLEKK